MFFCFRVELDGEPDDHHDKKHYTLLQRLCTMPILGRSCEWLYTVASKSTLLVQARKAVLWPRRICIYIYMSHVAEEHKRSRTLTTTQQ